VADIFFLENMCTPVLKHDFKSMYIRQLKIAHWLCAKTPENDSSCAAPLHLHLSVLLTVLTVA